MKTEVERLNPTRVRLTVEVPFEELKPSLDKAYRDIANQVNIPGFRRGKVPPAIIDRRLGRDVVIEQAIQDAVPKAYGDALREENVRPLGQPELDVEEVADDAPLSFTAEVDTRPDFQLPEYTGLDVQVEAAGVSDDEVDEQLDELRERFAVLRGTDRAVQDGGYVSIDLKAEVDGTELEDVSVNGMSYEVGGGGLVEGLDEALVGMSGEESKTFHTTLLGEREGEEADVTVTVQSVKEKQLPDLDDEFAETASEYDTLGELREDTRARLERSRDSTRANEAQEKVLDKLLELVDFPVPDSIVDQEVSDRKENLEQQLAGSGLDLADYLASQERAEEEYLEELQENALKSVRAGWLLDEIADAEEVTVEEEDLSAQVAQMSARMGVDPQAFANHLVESGRINQLIGEVRRGKALEAVVGKANVTDDAGNVVDLSPPAEAAGTGGAEEAEENIDEGDAEAGEAEPAER